MCLKYLYNVYIIFIRVWLSVNNSISGVLIMDIPTVSIYSNIKDVVQLKRELSLKVIYESHFFNVCFCNNFSDYQWTCIYTIQMMFKPRAKGR